jgi:hypothetical protein
MARPLGIDRQTGVGREGGGDVVNAGHDNPR